jgi:hypothetical protein
MLRTIEKHGNAVIQKVFDVRGNLLRYQAGIPNNGKILTACSTLSEARKVLGVQITPPTKTTKPKMANPQNQKGYNPHRR